MTCSVSYTEPVLCHYNYDLSKAWFIYFDITNQSLRFTVRKQFRGGINYRTVLKERIKYAEAYLTFWKQNLKDGWNPFEPLTPGEELQGMNIDEALKFSLRNCEIATSTKKAYSLCTKYIVHAANKLSIHHLRITEVKKFHIKLILKKCVEIYKWSNSNFNKQLGYLSALFGRLIEWEVIEYNPVHKIKPLPVAETRKYVPLTQSEKDKLREYLFIHNYRFFVYLSCIYQTGIRPKELLSLKIKDVDLTRQLITITPNLETENSKTKSLRYVPISNQLLPFLRELQLHNYTQEYYLFGSPYEPGKGNKGSAHGKLSGATHPDYFKPSLTKIKRDTVTRLWKTIVMGKLEINKYMYALKHSGCDDKLLAGISIDSLKELYGHSSKYMTEKYATVLKEIRQNEIKNLSPAF